MVACLLGGTVLSLGLMVANQWVPFLDWVAVVVALVAGFLATWAALVEFRDWRERAMDEAAADRAAERTRTQELHASQRAVLTTMDARVQAIAGALGEARTELDATRTELVDVKVALGEATAQASRLRGDNEALRSENRTLRADLDAARTVDDAAEVLTLPRRRLTEGDAEWGALEAPTVVDLDLQRLAQPFVAEVQARHAN